MDSLCQEIYVDDLKRELQCNQILLCELFVKLMEERMSEYITFKGQEVLLNTEGHLHLKDVWRACGSPYGSDYKKLNRGSDVYEAYRHIWATPEQAVAYTSSIKPEYGAELARVLGVNKEPSSTNALQVFKFEDGTAVRVTSKTGEELFIARDLVEAVGSVWDGAKSVAHVPEEWKGVVSVPTPGGKQEVICLSEAGMNFYLIRSDKPKALPIQKWLAGEVLPSIRKTGSYTAQKAPQSPLLKQDVNWLLTEQSAAAVNAANARTSKAEAENENLRQEAREKDAKIKERDEALGKLKNAYQQGFAADKARHEKEIEALNTIIQRRQNAFADACNAGYISGSRALGAVWRVIDEMLDKADIPSELKDIIKKEENDRREKNKARRETQAPQQGGFTFSNGKNKPNPDKPF